MHEILEFLSKNGFSVFLFFLFFGGGIAQFVHSVTERIHQRKTMEMQYKQRLRVLEERRQIAALTHDSIKLLLVDTDFAGDFDRRLRLALKQQKANEDKTQKVRIEVDTDDEPQESEESPRPPHKTKRSR